MMKKALSILLLVSLLLIGSVTAIPENWILVYPGHSGLVQLNTDHSGKIIYDTYGEQGISWELTDGTNGVAHWYFWSIPFVYHEDIQTITSPSVPDARLEPTEISISEPELTFFGLFEFSS